METFFNDRPKITWESIDDEKQDSDGTISDYKVNHNDLGLTVIELKELQDADRFQEQQKVVNEIEKKLKGVIPNIAFNCRFDTKNQPNQKQIADFKKFLKKICNSVIAPCRIVFPADPIYPITRLIEIQRIDHDGNLIERVYSPPTQSGKYPRGQPLLDNHRRLDDPCVVIEGEEKVSHEEKEIFLGKGKAQISLFSTENGKGGSIYGQGVGGTLTEDERIRKRFYTANSQLKAYSHLGCPLGFVCCPSGYRLTGFLDLVDAIMGEHLIGVKRARQGEPLITEPFHGGGRMLQHDKNTTISYCGWLDNTDGPTRLKIIHNDFSPGKLLYEFFDGPSTEQFIMEYRVEVPEVKGNLVELTSSKQLSDIRESNKEPIALMRES